MGICCHCDGELREGSTDAPYRVSHAYTGTAPRRVMTFDGGRPGLESWWATGESGRMMCRADAERSRLIDCKCAATDASQCIEMAELIQIRVWITWVGGSMRCGGGQRNVAWRSHLVSGRPDTDRINGGSRHMTFWTTLW